MLYLRLPVWGNQKIPSSADASRTSVTSRRVWVALRLKRRLVPDSTQSFIPGIRLFRGPPVPVTCDFSLVSFGAWCQIKEAHPWLPSLPWSLYGANHGPTSHSRCLFERDGWWRCHSRPKSVHCITDNCQNVLGAWFLPKQSVTLSKRTPFCFILAG